MNLHGYEWDPRRDREARQTLNELRALDESGYFQGVHAAAELSARFLPAERHYPNLAGWMARVERLPGFERTWPPHWKAADPTHA